MSEKSSAFLEIFRGMAEELGLPELYFDRDDTCRVTFGDGLVVSLHLDTASDILTIYGVVGDLGEKENRSLILSSLMEGNYFWMATDGFTLSIEEGGWHVLLAGKQDVAAFSDGEMLHAYIQTFADSVREWADLCKTA